MERGRTTWVPGDGQIHIHIGKPCRSSACLVRIAGPCLAVPFQLVPVQLRHTNVRAYEPANSHQDAAYSQLKLPLGSKEAVQMEPRQGQSCLRAMQWYLTAVQPYLQSCSQT